MSFIKEFIGDLIQRNMEDPEKRREWWNNHLRSIEAKAQKRLVIIFEDYF